jgi:hypothetical protein
VRLKEMFLRTSRRLWRKFYPMLHAFTRHGAVEEHTVVGPGQLRELGDTNLDRLVNLNQRVAGPIPFSGEDVSLVVGLYAIPGADASKALIDTVGNVAQLAGTSWAWRPRPCSSASLTPSTPATRCGPGSTSASRLPEMSYRSTSYGWTRER